MNIDVINTDAMNNDVMDTNVMNTDVMNTDVINTDNINTDVINTDVMANFGQFSRMLYKYRESKIKQGHPFFYFASTFLHSDLWKLPTNFVTVDQ